MLEAGVGGEYDSTSVIEANVSIFTPISLDHQEMLGESVQEIALTKLKAMSGQVILAKQRYEEVIRIGKKIAEQKGLVCEVWQDIHTDERFRNEVQDFTRYCQTHILPPFLCDNLHTAMCALDFLGMKFDFNTLNHSRFVVDVKDSHIILCLM